MAKFDNPDEFYGWLEGTRARYLVLDSETVRRRLPVFVGMLNTDREREGFLRDLKLPSPWRIAAHGPDGTYKYVVIDTARRGSI